MTSTRQWIRRWMVLSPDRPTEAAGPEGTTRIGRHGAADPLHAATANKPAFSAVGRLQPVLDRFDRLAGQFVGAAFDGGEIVDDPGRRQQAGSYPACSSTASMLMFSAGRR